MLKVLLVSLALAFPVPAKAITYIYTEGHSSCSSLNIAPSGVITCNTTGTNSIPFNFQYPLYCTPGVVISTTSGALSCLDFTDMWWTPEESGWGMSIVQHNKMIFATIYTYNENRYPVWYVISSCPLAGLTCTGTIYEVTGGGSLTTPWSAPYKRVTPVGNGTLEFNEPSTSKFTYTIKGVSGTKNIQRQGF